MKSVLVWDFPTRLFHWLLVVAIAAAYISGDTGGNWMVWHGRIGILIVGLISFRLVWGVAGSTYARFGTFVRGPATIKAYLAGKWHLGQTGEAKWPLQRGFERYYGFLAGETDQYHPDLIADNHQVSPPATPEEGIGLLYASEIKGVRRSGEDGRLLAESYLASFRPTPTDSKRDALIKKGLIYASERGRIAFTVPHFGRFLRAQAEAA